MVELRLFQESTHKPTDSMTFCGYSGVGRAVVLVRCWVTGSECEVPPDGDQFLVNWLADELTNTLYNRRLPQQQQQQPQQQVSLLDATLSYLDDDCHVEYKFTVPRDGRALLCVPYTEQRLTA